MPQLLPSDPVAHARARRRAVAVTWFVAVGWLYVVACLVKAWTEQVAAGALVFFLTGIATPFLVVLVLRVWRAERSTRPAWFDAQAGPGERAGVPELDAPTRPHTSLTGDFDNSPRW